MKNYGVFPIEMHYTYNGMTGESKFDYDSWSQLNENKLQLSNFIKSLSTQIDTGGLGDLLSNRIIARMQSAAEMPAMKLVGDQNKLVQTKRLNELESAGLEMPTSVGPLKLLDYQIVQYKDKNGKVIMHDDQPLFLLKAKYGYRLVDVMDEEAYNYNMHDLALKVFSEADSKRMYLGDVKRSWFNSMIYADDLAIHFYSPYRFTGNGEYNNLDLNGRKTKPKKDHWLSEMMRGLVLGPTITVATTKPMARDRVEDLISILKLKSAGKIMREEVNN